MSNSAKKINNSTAQQQPATPAITVKQRPAANLNLELPFVMFLCAAPKSGKSTAIKFLIYNLAKAGKFKYGWCFSSTLINGDYDFIPDGYKSGEFTEEKLNRIMRFQEIQRQRNNGSVVNCFLIIDDMIGSINPNAQIWSKLITTSRHYGISIFFAVQYAYKMPPVMRTCCTYAVVFKQKGERDYNALYESFMQDHNNLAAAKKFITEGTAEKYRFILIATDEDPEKKYTFSKALIVPQFRLNY